jgi:uncharacterized protein
VDIAITGSSGLIGSALTTYLEREGHRVVRLVRPQTRERDGDSVAWDPTTCTIDAGRLEGVDAVVHLAGAGIGDRRWTDAYKKQIVESRTAGTGLLAAALARLQRPPAVLVSASAVGYYGDGGEQELTEASPPGTGFRTEVVTAWEGAALPAVDAGIRTVFPRMANVLSTDGGLLPFLLTPFRFGLGARFGSGKQWFPWVTLDDTVAAIAFAIERADLRGPVNVAAPQPVRNAEFAKTLGRVLRRPAPWWAPAPVLEVIAGPERAREAILSSAKVVPAALLDAGFTFGDPELEPALRRIVSGKRATADVA